MKAKKNNATLTRTSAFRENRKNYLTESGYTYYCWDEDLKKEVPVNITLGDEFLNADGTTGTIDREILILLDSIDHDEYVGRTSMNATLTRYSQTGLPAMSVPARAVRMWQIRGTKSRIPNPTRLPYCSRRMHRWTRRCRRFWSSWMG